jgi:DNA-binding NarL/FixJ family response regulator
MFKVLIADDHAIVRKGLCQIINEASNMMVGGEACNGQEVLEKVRQDEWDVLVLDISMPVRNGLDVLHEVHYSHPRLPVLVLSVYPEEQYAIRVLKAGASGYMNKECALEELVEAIGKVVSGGCYVSPSLAEKLALEVSGNKAARPHERLSDREYRVLVSIGAGKSLHEIADELMLSTKTISTYRSRVLEKMNMTRNAELIRYVIEHHLV